MSDTPEFIELTLQHLQKGYAARNGRCGHSPNTVKRPISRDDALRLRHAMVFTTGDVSRICHVAPRTVSKWFDSGKLRGYRIPGSQDRRIPREQLIQFMRDNRIPLGPINDPVACVLLVGVDVLLADRVQDGVAAKVRWLTAADSFKAGQITAIEVPDCAVVDMSGLARDDGLRLARSLRNALPGVLLVGLATEDEPDAQQLAAVFDTVILRPIDPATLRAVVRQLAEDLGVCDD